MHSCSSSTNCARSLSARGRSGVRPRHSDWSSASGWRRGSHCLAMTIALSILWASGCGMRRTQALRPPAPSPELLAPCLRPPPATDSSMRALVTNHVESMEILDDCARRQRELAGWARVVSATGIDAWWQQ